VTPSRLLLQCRAGFERECAQEITESAGAMGVEGFVKAKPDSGFAVFHAHQDDMGADLGGRIDRRSGRDAGAAMDGRLDRSLWVKER